MGLANKFPKNHTLRKKILNNCKTKWLDVGSTKFEDGFDYLNLWATEEMTADQKKRFHQADLLNFSDTDLIRLGQFDLIRMQHVFEHFSFEEGNLVLKICSQLLKPNGYLLTSVSDLRKFARAYLKNFRVLADFANWARWRVSKDAPASCVFSVHVHQMGYHPNAEPGRAHKWCYNYEKLYFQIMQQRVFKNVRPIGLFNPLSSIPFTHQRPGEDVVLVAQKKEEERS